MSRIVGHPFFTTEIFHVSRLKKQFLFCKKQQETDLQIHKKVYNKSAKQFSKKFLYLSLECD